MEDESNGQYSAILSHFAHFHSSIKDPNLTEYQRKFGVLLATTERSFSQLQRFIGRITDLNTSILSVTTQLRSAIAISQEDSVSVNALKKDIDRVWKQVEQSRSREEEAKQKLEILNEKIEAIQSDIDHGCPGSDRSAEIEKMKEKSEFLRKKLDSLQQVRNTLILETNQLEEQIAKIQKKHSVMIKELQALTDKKKDMMQELSNIAKSRRVSENDLSELKFRIDELAEEIASKEQEIATMDRHLRDEEADKQKKRKEVELLIREEMRRSDIRELEMKNLKEHITENAKLESYIESVIISKSKVDESINATKQAKEKCQKTIDKINKRKRRREMVASDLKLKQERINHEILDFKEEIKEMEEQLERERAYVEKSKKEKKILDKSIRMAGRDVERLASEVLVRRGHLRNVETLLKGYSKSAQNRRNDQYRLEQERDKYDIACAEAERRLEDAKEAVLSKKQETNDLQEKIVNGQERLKQQQALLDQVTQERNTYSKNLIDAQREIETMKREWEHMIDQIQKFKNDIKQKEVEKIETTEDLAKLLDKNQKLKDHEKNQQERIKELDIENRKLERQISKLNAIIREADTEVNKQQKEFEAVVNDRDILGAQLIKRNDELAQLYERIKSQQSIVAKASVQYEQKMRDIEVITNRINELTQNKAKLEYKTRDLESLQSEVNLLQRTLIEEKQKLRALEDEKNTPLNVHPWRRIEGSDPWSYSMVSKIQELQKSLIEKTEQVLQKDLLIQQKEKLYLELRRMIARMPGVEANVQWEKYRKSLNGKQEQYENLKKQVRDTRIKIRQFKDNRQDLMLKWEDVGAQYRKTMKSQSSNQKESYEPQFDEELYAQYQPQEGA